MDMLFGESLSVQTALFLLLALALALSFEFVNGFHDTANAVATVIYTNALEPNTAVVWSGCWNLIGVLSSSGAVAFGIIALLPVELVINVGSGAGFAMVFALLISAIVWNLGTWYLGLPASSSHTLIGSIMGVGLANSLFSANHAFGDGVNWAKAKDVGLSLLVSPVVGFCAAALLLLLAKALLRKPALYSAPDPGKPPPLWIRSILILTCTGVSFAHGSNDGQKGMGLIMLILIGILPGAYALNLETSTAAIAHLQISARTTDDILKSYAGATALKPEDAGDELSNFLSSAGTASERTYAALQQKNGYIAEQLNGKRSLRELSRNERSEFRTVVYLVGKSLDKLHTENTFTDPRNRNHLTTYRADLDNVTRVLPDFVKYATALALGLGTMIGWKRIVVTVGEKIGKAHLTYAQGAAAELVAMSTIGAADYWGLPVSTTHVLSSGVAGTMAANRSGLQMDTLKNLLLAWVLTLPVCVLLGATFFAAGLYVVAHWLGL